MARKRAIPEAKPAAPVPTVTITSYAQPPPPPPPDPEEVPPESPESPRGPAPWFYLTLDQWRASNERVTWMATLLRDQTFRELLGMLHQEASLATRVPQTADQIAMEFGRSLGRRDILGMIEAAGQGSIPEIEALNYGVPDITGPALP